MKKNVAVTLLMGLLVLGSVAEVRASVVQVPVPAITSWSSATFESDDFAWTIGFQFKANENLSVLALGVYDIHVPTDVGLWDDSGKKLASILVSDTGSLMDGFRYADLSNPVSLKAGDKYRIGANVKSWFSDPVGLVTSPQITYLAGTFADGGNTFPEPFETNYITANFLSVVAPVPVPSSALLFASGLIGLIGRRSKTTA